MLTDCGSPLRWLTTNRSGFTDSGPIHVNMKEWRWMIIPVRRCRYSSLLLTLCFSLYLLWLAVSLGLLAQDEIKSEGENEFFLESVFLLIFQAKPLLLYVKNITFLFFFFSVIDQYVIGKLYLWFVNLLTYKCLCNTIFTTYTYHQLNSHDIC